MIVRRIQACAVGKIESAIVNNKNTGRPLCQQIVGSSSPIFAEICCAIDSWRPWGFCRFGADKKWRRILPSAPSRLKIGVADFVAFGETCAHKEVPHEQEVRCASVR
jgi:hypothetical protein